MGCVLSGLCACCRKILCLEFATSVNEHGKSNYDAHLLDRGNGTWCFSWKKMMQGKASRAAAMIRNLYKIEKEINRQLKLIDSSPTPAIQDVRSLLRMKREFLHRNWENVQLYKRRLQRQNPKVYRNLDWVHSRKDLSLEVLNLQAVDIEEDNIQPPEECVEDGRRSEKDEEKAAEEETLKKIAGVQRSLADLFEQLAQEKEELLLSSLTSHKDPSEKDSLDSTEDIFVPEYPSEKGSLSSEEVLLISRDRSRKDSHGSKESFISVSSDKKQDTFESHEFSSSLISAKELPES